MAFQQLLKEWRNEITTSIELRPELSPDSECTIENSLDMRLKAEGKMITTFAEEPSLRDNSRRISPKKLRRSITFTQDLLKRIQTRVTVKTTNQILTDREKEIPDHIIEPPAMIGNPLQLKMGHRHLRIVSEPGNESTSPSILVVDEPNKLSPTIKPDSTKNSSIKPFSPKKNLFAPILEIENEEIFNRKIPNYHKIKVFSSMMRDPETKESPTENRTKIPMKYPGKPSQEKTEGKTGLTNRRGKQRNLTALIAPYLNQGKLPSVNQDYEKRRPNVITLPKIEKNNVSVSQSAKRLRTYF